VLGPLPPTVGGVTTFITGMLESDLNEKYRLITFGTERPTVGIVRDVSDYTVVFQIGLFRLIKSIVWTISHLLTFPFVLFKNRPDIVHVCTASYWSFWENAVYVLISEMLSKKTFFHIHGGGFDEFYKNSNRFVKFLIRKILNLPDIVIVLSSTGKRIFANFISENKIAVLENFVDFSRYNKFKREANLSKDMITVLFIGGVGAREKGLYDVFKAMLTVIKRCKNIMFLFVACSSIEKLNGIREKEEITSHTKFLGYLHGEEKIRVFSESDIFVLPSYSEGLPITMLEAMAAGLPVIATSVGAIPEVIEEGKNGFLIEVGDYHGLAQKILILAKDKRLRWKMATNNINKIKRLYDRTIIMRKIGNLYAELLGN
jgi:glycosyltransferase involved in cell wall biosynthesis